MSIWAGIKHALNSTLGTSDFKPLDQLIIGERAFVASDTAYSVMLDGAQSTTATIGSFTPKLDGYVRVIAKVQTTALSGTTSSIQVGNKYMYFAGGNGEVVKSIDIRVTANASYVVSWTTAGSGTGRHQLNNVIIGAQIADTTLMEVDT